MSKLNYTTMAINYSTNPPVLATTKQMIPKEKALSQNASTSGIWIVGDVNSKFLTEMPTGSYIVDFTNNEFREVINVQSDSLAQMAYPFTTDLANGKQYVVNFRDLNLKKIGLTPVTAGATIVDDAGALITIPTAGIEFTKSGNDDSAGKDMITPVMVDASTHKLFVVLEYSA